MTPKTLAEAIRAERAAEEHMLDVEALTDDPLDDYFEARCAWKDARAVTDAFLAMDSSQ